MRTGTAVGVTTLLSALGVNAQAPKSLFFTASDGTRIHYFDIAGQGSPVVLIHGYTANAEGKWLARHQRRIISAIYGGSIPGETHGSVHLNPTYTSTLVKFIDAHDHP